MNKNHLSKLLIIALFSSVVQISYGANKDANKTVTYSSMPAKVHILTGYKNWNDVLFKLTGVLRDSCHTKGETSAVVQGEQILIQNNIIFTPDVPCLRVLTPYQDEVLVPDLKMGEFYDVLIMDAKGEYHEITSFQMQ